MKALTRDEEPPMINKQLFDQCWSLLDFKRDPTRVSRMSADRKAHLDTFIQESGLNIRDLPMPVLYELRQPTTKEMETVSINHITVHLESRISAYVLWRIANLPSALYLKTRPIRNVSRRIVRKLMGGEPHLDPSFNLDETPQLSLTELQGVLTDLNGMLHHLLYENGRRRTDSQIRKDAHHFLPFLYHVASEFERVHIQRQQLRQDLGDQITKSERRRLLVPKWRAAGLILPGKPFALLPDWQLQPVFVEYAPTQLASLFGSKLGKMDVFQEKVFDLHRVSALRRKDWSMMKFKTNGVELQVFLGALNSRHPPAYNAQHLKEAGYNLKKPPGKGINVMTTERGAYRILQDRYDNLAVEAIQADKIMLGLVDPGVIKVVAVRSIMLSDITTPTDVIEKSRTWCVREEDYKKDTGWERRKERELMRRSGTRIYHKVITGLRQTRKRTTSLETYMEYVRTYTKNLRVLSRELLSRSRRVSRYLSMKNLQKTLDRLADRLTGKTGGTQQDGEGVKRVVAFGDGSFRAKKGHVSVPRKKLVIKCSHRALTFVFSERGSSKYCPTSRCGGVMKDLQGCRRLRRCSSDRMATSSVCFQGLQ